MSVQGDQLDELWSNYYVEISATFWFNVLSHEKKEEKKKTQMGKLISLKILHDIVILYLSTIIIVSPKPNL